MGVLRVELEHGPPAPAQAGVQRGEEGLEPLVRAVVRLVRVAQPLECADADGAVKGTRSEGEPVAQVAQQQVSLHLPLQGDAQHGAGDVHAHPHVAVLLDALPREAGAAAKVKDERGLVLGQGQQLKGAGGHVRLDLHHAGAGGRDKRAKP